MHVLGLKLKLWFTYIVFQLMIISVLKLTLFLLIKWAEAALIYKAVIVRNLINQAAPMAIKNIETM